MGRNANAKDDDGDTALRVEASIGHLDIEKLLREQNSIKQ